MYYIYIVIFMYYIYIVQYGTIINVMLLLIGGCLLGYKVARTLNSTVCCLRMSNFSSALLNFSSAILYGLHLLKSIYKNSHRIHIEI